MENERTSNNEKTLPQTSCRQCGTCCEKGGPAFHIKDMHLIEKGIIPSRNLYTIRQGELARDNVTGQLIPVSTDIIKLKGKGNTWACVFYSPKGKSCEIYEHRPIECSALKCWDTEPFKAMYSKNYLTRERLLSSTRELWEIIQDHQVRCSYAKIIRFTNISETGEKEKTLKEIIDIIQYDISLRQVLVEKGGMDADTIDFLLGRPLVNTMKNYGFKVDVKEDKYILTPVE